jgi:hypothetical protein
MFRSVICSNMHDKETLSLIVHIIQGASRLDSGLQGPQPLNYATSVSLVPIRLDQVTMASKYCCTSIIPKCEAAIFTRLSQVVTLLSHLWS